MVMAHDFSATKELRLPAYAERFCAAGIGVLLFDYRHFGASGGETSAFLVELPGIDTDALPGKMASGLLFRSNSFRFIPARYLRFRFRVLTASRRFRSATSLHEAPRCRQLPRRPTAA
jgi:hypothetical protein